MDQYPDEDEEFELRYQEELELLDDLPNEDEENYAPINVAPKPTTSKSSAASTPQLSQPAPQQTGYNKIDSINSPALSQISFGFDDGPSTSKQAAVNRRLFGTPKGPVQRISSTPLVEKQRLADIEEVAEVNSPQPTASAAAALQYQGIRSKRRLECDLFGDIGDLYDQEEYEDPLAKKMRTGLYGQEDYEDPLAKKLRTEEERDLDTIAKILDTRKRLQESGRAIRRDDLARLQAVHAFKMKNLAYSVPKWPFLALRRGDDKRIYVRYHNEDYETRAIDSVSAKPDYGGLLGESKAQIWSAAGEIVLRRATQAQSQADLPALPAVPITNRNDKLWVEKYKPRKYMDLLSDETTNRSLLYWLKMWDKVVFGKEFKGQVENVDTSKLNSFNKRTGKFESTGGWKQRKTRLNLNLNVDDLGRPMQKVALLCGPPGLGKTTLAHTIARHAGYSVREINASDDRSPEAFKQALENGTQMTAVLNEGGRPNCIILDEIDGAPRQSIEFLVKFVSDTALGKVRPKGKKGQRNILKRPIICICNDVYDPALRPLRQMAFVVTFPPIDSALLADRLVQIASKEHLKTDFGTLIALAEKSGNDVRCCISTMQFFGAQKKPLTLHDVLSQELGQKDRHQGLFDIWGAIFRIQRPKKQLEKASAANEQQAQIIMTNTSAQTRMNTVLDVVHGGSDYERLMQGVYENFLQQKMPDPNLNGVVEALQWFCFSDTLHRQINQLQNYAVYPYLQYGFVVWHLLFASLAWPKITFPMKGYEFKQKSVNQKHIFQAFRKGISSGAVGVGQGHVVLVEVVPMLKRILSPVLRSVAVQLLSAKEQQDLKHTVDIMVDLGLTYMQVKSADGPYLFQMEPDLETLSRFPGSNGLTLTYFGRQLFAREVELERVRRASPKVDELTDKAKAKAIEISPKNVPNHLRKLKPKRVDNANTKTLAKDVVSKDFFGRVQTKSAATLEKEAQSDPIVKSPIWYRYKQGYNNAVRKDVHMNELL